MYLVTGATGNVGSKVVAQLLDRKEKVRVFVRDPGKVADWGNRVEIAIGDFGKPDAFARAIAGAEGAFLMNGGLESEPFRQLIAAARAQGKPGIVFLSTLLAGAPEFQIGKLHKDKEDAIRESGLPGKFIRPGGFMTNSYQWIGTIKAEGVVYNAMGTGKSAPIAPEDIAAVSLKAMTVPSLFDEGVELTRHPLLRLTRQGRILAERVWKAIPVLCRPHEPATHTLIR